MFLESADVILLEYFMQPDGTLESTMKDYQEEILEQTQGAKSVMLQIICGNDFELMMSDVNSLASFVEKLDKDVNFYWGIEYEETTAFKVKIEVYIVR